MARQMWEVAMRLLLQCWMLIVKAMGVCCSHGVEGIPRQI